MVRPDAAELAVTQRVIGASAQTSEIIRYPGAAQLSFFGSDEYYPVSSPASINSRSGCIFGNVNAFNVVGINTCQGITASVGATEITSKSRYAVNYN
jgi:hypothetical protein